MSAPDPALSLSITPSGFSGQKHFDSARWFYIGILGLYLLASPVYLFKSGLPQPADFLILLAVIPGLSLLIMNSRVKIPPLYMAGGIFVAMTIVINLVNYVFYPDMRFVFQSMMYVYNFCVFIFTAFLFRHYKVEAAQIARVAIALAIGIQLAAIAFFPDVHYRQTALFNNPNQLSYWALLTMMMVVVMKTRGRLNLFDFMLIGGTVYLQSASLSKAGIITSALALLVFPFTPQFTKRGRVTLAIFIFGLSFYTALNYERVAVFEESFEALNRVVQRVAGIGQERDDNLDVRDYDRLIDFPLYTLLGAGEGAFERFDREARQSPEIHSGLATVFFSYGIVGGLAFVSFMALLALRLPWYYAALLACVFIYGIPHQHLRFTHFWVFLGMLEASIFWIRNTKGGSGAPDTHAMLRAEHLSQPLKSPPPQDHKQEPEAASE